MHLHRQRTARSDRVDRHQASERVLAQLVEYFDLHYAFLRHSDHNIRASVLAAEWPRRSDVAAPDPFAVVSFTSDHPALAVCDDGKELVTVHRSYDDGGRAQGMVARTGGDEFVVVPNQPMTTRAAEMFAERIRTTVHDRLTIEHETVTRTVSIGVAAGMPGRDRGIELLRRADDAVLAAKRAGGNQITVASDSSLKRLIRNDIQGHLQGDVDHDALLLRYLPEIDLWTGAIVAAEALVRWRHPARGVLLPKPEQLLENPANFGKTYWKSKNRYNRLYIY
jgi:predicted signal transduction protein with EAL and GGDEF domain